MSYASVSGHRSMALDATRNQLYREALEQVVRPDSVVLDLGAGTGIHGLIAARLGAKRVYLVEPEDILAVAEEIVAANGLQERVRCLRGRIEDIQLPEPVDIIVSAATGNFLLTEDLLPTLFHARDTALKPGGLLLPGAATMEATPVSAAALHAKEIAGWSTPAEGIDLSAARPYAANSVFYRWEELGDVAYLAEPRILQTFDFSRDNYANVHIESVYEITQSGICHGWVGWFSMKLGDRWVSTSPRDEPLHWSPAFLPLDPPVAFEQGERVSFTLDRAPFGDWTWRIRSATTDQRHSTLLSAPMDAATLKKAVVDYAPSLNVDGQALAQVLAQCDGSVSAGTIAASLRDRYPERYHSAAEALAFVQRIIKRYA
jgi:SAM-dependent methyltransferase